MGPTKFAFDIETDTLINGLDPRVAEVISIGLWTPSTQQVISGGNETSRLERFAELLESFAPGVVVGWNSAVFDVPFLATRSAITGVDLGLTLVPDHAIVPKYESTPPHTCGYRVRFAKHTHADIAYAYKAYADQAGVKWSLKPVCESLGIEMVKVDPLQIHLLTPEELTAYNLSDVNGTYILAERLGDEFDRLVDQVAVPAA